QAARVRRCSAFLIVIKIDKDSAPLTLANLDAPRPSVQAAVRIVIAIAPVWSVTAHVDVVGRYHPWCSSKVVVREAQRDTVLGQMIDDAIFVPRGMPEFECVVAARGQHLDEPRQSLTISFEISGKLEE